MRVKNAIREGRAHILRSLMQGNQDDLIPLEKSLSELVAAGTVSFEDAARFASSVEYLDDLVKVRKDRARR